jgi:predicted helicase
LERLAKELAREVCDLNGQPDGALAAYRRFLNEDRHLLGNIDHDAVSPEGRLWELLRRELNAGDRRRRGMFFTPRPLVNFIIRGVGELLPRLGRTPRKHRWHVIDPACGYGAFLIDAVRQLRATCYTGMEIDGPTCTVARMLLGNCEAATALQITEANPLLAGESLREVILGPPGQPLVPIIVGNPPWSNFGRRNRGPWIDSLLQDYRAGLGERKSNLADDAIKFLRWGQYWIDEARAGILAFVTPNTWLTGLTHRRMRQSLLDSFDELSILDLGGQTGGKTDEPEDQNVFGVRSGVAIVLAIQCERPASGGPRRDETLVRHVALGGSRTEKLAALAEDGGHTIRWQPLRPASPDWLLAAPCASLGSRAKRGIARQYADFWPLDRIFREYTSGVQTKNDAVFVGFTRQQLGRQVRGWLIQQTDPPPFDAGLIRPYLVAPFDRRWIYYDPRVLGRARWAVMRHMLLPNLGLAFMRQSTNAGEYDHFLAVDCLVSDRVFYSRHGAPFLAPLWLHKAPTSGRQCKAPTSGRGDGRVEPAIPIGPTNGRVKRQITLTNGQGFESGQGFEREANFAPEYVEAIAAATGQSPEPLQLIHYLYAVAYSPRYRARFADELRRGFPRLPLPVNREQYRRLAELGGQLVELHMAGAGHSSSGAGLLPAKDIHDASCNGFRIGGYDVPKRWARPRQARGLTAEEDRQFDRLTWLGRQTRRLKEAIDCVHEA